MALRYPALDIASLIGSKIVLYDRFLGLAVVNFEGEDKAGFLFQTVDGARTYLLTAGAPSAPSYLEFLDISDKTPFNPAVSQTVPGGA